MLTELGLASWATIAHRTALMAKGICSPVEYTRMLAEKVTACQQSAALLMRRKRNPSLTAVVAPWHRKATANARRLRRKK
ncbi:MAG TPA: hypothetical protein VFL96_09815 [Acidobacteriaceae bacterium]|jgi:hypothetical protein|nr:hypothetical protein [Acidobacteriaceae bacterium]